MSAFIFELFNLVAMFNRVFGVDYEIATGLQI